MSLDVSLTGKTNTETCTCPSCWNEHAKDVTEELYEANITHNLGSMAEEAGIYKHLWTPEEIGIIKASHLISPLRAGLKLLRSDPARFKKYNAANGWGLYEHFVPFVQEYLEACIAYPDADVKASR